MHLISAGKLKQAASKYPDVTTTIKAFCKTIEQAHPRHLLQWVKHPQRSVSQWQSLIDLQHIYRDAEAVGTLNSFKSGNPEPNGASPPNGLSRNFTVFNVKGNKYRLILDIDYEEQIAYFKYFLTHAQYDKRCDPALYEAVSFRAAKDESRTRTKTGKWKNDSYY